MTTAKRDPNRPPGKSASEMTADEILSGDAPHDMSHGHTMEATQLNESSKSGATQQPESEFRPATRYEQIEDALRSKEVVGRLCVTLGLSTKKESSKTEAFKYIGSVLQEIKRSTSDPDKDLTKCSPDSIVGCIIDAASFKLPIDGRKLAHIIGRGGEAQLQIGYKGFVYKIAELYKDVDFSAEPVFDGDELVMRDESGYQTYTLAKANPFMDDITKMKGIITCLAYSDGIRHSKTAALSKDVIEKIKKSAKMKAIWESWYVEKAKVAGIKRICKLNFASAMGLQQLIQYDNERNFDIDPSTPNGDKTTPANSTAKLSALLEHKPEEIITSTVSPVAVAQPVNAESINKA